MQLERGLVIALLAATACERAPELDRRPAVPAPTVSRAPAPIAKPVVSLPTPAPPAPPAAFMPPAPPVQPAPEVPRPPRPRRAAVEPLPTADELPTPPSDDPAEYANWLRGLTKVDQRKIARFCKANPVEYETACGGIGPLHIPVPPSMVKMPRQGAPSFTRDDWHAGLSAAQQRYVEVSCRGEENGYSQLCGGTPLVVSFDDAPVAFTQGGRFAFMTGDPVSTDWPTAATPWIALDRDGDGAITNGGELFGSFTPMADGSTPKDGFVALATLDANRDGQIDRDDPGYAQLVLWADRDADRQSTPDELVPLSSVIVSIALTYRIEARCDDRRNCERERSAMTWQDRTGATRTGTIVDVHLPYRDR